MPERVYTNRYEIVRHLAQGGMAEVYLAHDQLLDRRVALKVLFAEFARDPAFVQRFRREAQSAANLSHPNIVAVYDWGEEDNTYFIVMEYVEGRSLREAIHAEGPMYPNLAADLASDIAGALAFAHRNGVVHRDVKPGNILLTPNGQVKVADFGIARAGGASEGLTQTGSVMGTATYFSPEQAQGLPVDARSDVYSLGVVLYEMVCGVPPFSGESPISVAYKHVREEPPPPTVVNPAVPAGLETIILTALAKSPEERFPSADDLRADLARFRRGEPVGPVTAVVVPARPVPGSEPTTVVPRVARVDATRVGTVVPSPPTAGYRRRRSAWPFAIAIVVLLAVLGVLGLLLANELSNDNETAGTIELEELIGRTLEQAQAIVEADGLVAEVTQEENDEIEKGRVFAQSPEPGTRVKDGATVKLTVSAGKGETDVPDVNGKSLEDAEEALIDAGFDTRTRQEVSDSVTSGSVIRTDPESGTKATRGSTVTIFVSTGVELVVVPDVSNKDEVTAAAELGRAGFTPQEVSEASDTVEAGTVIRTEPAAGQSVPKGSEVRLVVSAGKEEFRIPDVIGLSQGQATANLDAAGFTVEVQEFTTLNPSQNGKVISQTPNGGQRAAKGSAVTITVGRLGTGGGGGDSTTTSPSSTTSTTKKECDPIFNPC